MFKEFTYRRTIHLRVQRSRKGKGKQFRSIVFDKLWNYSVAEMRTDNPVFLRCWAIRASRVLPIRQRLDPLKELIGMDTILLQDASVIG